MGKLNIILIGVGGWGRGWVRRLVNSDDWTLAAVVDRDDAAHARAQEAAENEDLPCYASLADAVAAGVEADAVHVAVSSPYHAAICTEALQAGLHVLVEKPFVTSYEDALRLADLADQVGRYVMVQQNYRHLPHVQAVRKAVTSGKYGPPSLGAVQFFLRHKGKPYQHALRHVNGLEMAIHHFDMMRFIFAQTPQSVFAHEENPAWSWYTHGASIQALWRFPGACRISYTSTFVTAGQRSPWEGVWRLDCEQASIVLDDLGDGFGAYSMTADGHELLCAQRTDGMGTHGSLREFASAIRERRRPTTDARDNLKTLAMVFAVGRSAEEGRPVSLSEFDEAGV